MRTGAPLTGKRAVNVGTNNMKQVGILYGCRLMLDTEDSERAVIASRWLEKLDSDSKELSKIKTESELRKHLSPLRRAILAFQNPSK